MKRPHQPREKRNGSSLSQAGPRFRHHECQRRGDDVNGAVITNAGHWLMEEQPAQTVAIVRAFLDGE
jgi:pimeloyl-ACP methyl ester carboxylesterase